MIPIIGLGFADALSPLALTGSSLVRPLAGFNLGVELGQAIAIALWRCPRRLRSSAWRGELRLPPSGSSSQRREIRFRDQIRYRGSYREALASAVLPFSRAAYSREIAGKESAAMAPFELEEPGSLTEALGLLDPEDPAVH